MNRYLLVLFMIFIGFESYVYGWYYPIKSFVISNCQNGEKYCNVNLPIIENADYWRYKNNAFYRSVYSMLWATTYFDGRDVGMGTHQGIDIAVPKGTEVYSMGNGLVVEVSNRGDWGKLVVIEHNFKGRKIYSSYSHLDNMYVNVGDVVSEKTVIGTVGDTGNTTGPHLHFQIDINQDGKHPFFPRGCFGSIDEIVNESRCQEQILKNTVDPILFIEKKGNIGITNTNYLSSKSELSQENLKISLMDSSIIMNGEKINIFVKSLNNFDSDDFYVLDKVLSVEFDNQKFDSNLNRVLVIGNGKSFSFESKSYGFSVINFKFGDEIIKKIPIIILDPVLHGGFSEDKKNHLQSLLMQIKI